MSHGRLKEVNDFLKTPLDDCWLVSQNCSGIYHVQALEVGSFRGPTSEEGMEHFVFPLAPIISPLFVPVPYINLAPGRHRTRLTKNRR